MILQTQQVTGAAPESRSVAGRTGTAPGCARFGISVPTVSVPKVLVHKYGGSSLGTAEQLRHVARTVAAGHRLSRPTVVVVSARGQSTDELLRLASTAGRDRGGRETDQLLATGECLSAALLAITLQDIGVPAVSLTGAQTGIRAIGKHGSGVIVDIDTRRLRRILATGEVAVVAGFQGVNDAGDIITLGRGGSDTTAVALAAVLDAGQCEIYTDVPGVSTADPRVVGPVRVLPSLDVGVMAEMSFAGAKVLHSRAVELAAMHGIQLHVRSSQPGSPTNPGTVIPVGSDTTMLETRGVVVAVAHDLDVARVLLQCGSRRGDLISDILALLSQHAVPVDMVARSGPYEDEFRMGFTMRRQDVDEALHAVRDVMSGLGVTMHVDKNVGKLSLIGMGLLNRPEYTARMLSALSAAGIPTSWLSTSQLRTSVVIPLDQVLGAVQLLHDEFELDRDQLGPVSATPA